MSYADSVEWLKLQRLTRSDICEDIGQPEDFHPLLVEMSNDTTALEMLGRFLT